MKLLGKIKCLFVKKEPEPWDGYKLPPRDISEPVLTIAALMETQPERWEFQCDGKNYPEVVDTVTGEGFRYNRGYDWRGTLCFSSWMTTDEKVYLGSKIELLIKRAEEVWRITLLEKAKEERERLKGLYL